MRNIDKLHSIILDKFNIEDITHSEGRHIFQSKMYLLQELGIDMGYMYIWYVLGPHSPSLMAYANDNVILSTLMDEDISKYQVSPKLIKKIETVNSLEESKPEELGLSEWYQLLASLSYIWKNASMWDIKDIDVESVIGILDKELPHFERKDIERAIAILIKNQLIMV